MITTIKDYEDAKRTWNEAVGEARVDVVDTGFTNTGWSKIYHSDNGHEFCEINTIETREVEVEGIKCYVKILCTEYFSDIDSESKKFYSSWT